jgi:hypothetical protein
MVAERQRLTAHLGHFIPDDSSEMKPIAVIDTCLEKLSRLLAWCWSEIPLITESALGDEFISACRGFLRDPTLAIVGARLTARLVIARHDRQAAFELVKFLINHLDPSDMRVAEPLVYEIGRVFKHCPFQAEEEEEMEQYGDFLGCLLDEVSGQDGPQVQDAALVAFARFIAANNTVFDMDHHLRKFWEYWPLSGDGPPGSSIVYGIAADCLEQGRYTIMGDAWAEQLLTPLVLAFTRGDMRRKAGTRIIHAIQRVRADPEFGPILEAAVLTLRKSLRADAIALLTAPSIDAVFRKLEDDEEDFIDSELDERT